MMGDRPFKSGISDLDWFNSLGHVAMQFWQVNDLAQESAGTVLLRVHPPGQMDLGE
jgi:hypothetical protein